MFRGRKADRDRFFHGRRRDASFQKGDLKYIILDLLKEKPRHGYEIIRDFEDLSHGFYKPSPGAVYPTLQMLEDMGYATAVEQGGKKVYSITEQGENFLEEQKDLADGVRNQVKKWWGFKRIGGMVMVMKEYHALENLLGRGFRSMEEDKAQRIRQVLINAYHAIEEIIEE
jgi:DNA-binding PadR family transcriptional regulator